MQEEEKKIPGENNSGTESDVENGTVGSDIISEEKVNNTEKAAAPAETGTADNGEVNEAPEVEQNEVSGDVDTETEPVEPVEEKMLTQSQVNELVGKARAEGRESAMKELYGRYGVNDDNEMNDIFGRGQGYDLLNDEYTGLQGRYSNLAAENALLKTQVVANRWDDVKAILGSKGMEVSVENIEAEIATHPEWKNSVGVSEINAPKPVITPSGLEEIGNNLTPKQEVQPTSQVRKLGSSVPEPKVNEEDSEAMKYFGLN